MELVACGTCAAEIYRSPDDPDRECMRCFRIRETPFGLSFRIDDWENIGQERTDSTQGEIITLPTIPVSVGRDKNGRERFEQRTPTVADYPTRRAFLDAAKAAGLSPGDDNRYRTVGQR